MISDALSPNIYQDLLEIVVTVVVIFKALFVADLLLLRGS